MARVTLEDLSAQPAEIDTALLDATSEADIRRQMLEDGDDPDGEPREYEATILPQAVRRQLGMTQQQFARALRIPVATLRNWEQNRVRPDPAARALLLIVHRDPKAALQALAA